MRFRFMLTALFAACPREVVSAQCAAESGAPLGGCAIRHASLAAPGIALFNGARPQPHRSVRQAARHPLENRTIAEGKAHSAARSYVAGRTGPLRQPSKSPRTIREVL
jgi:hypothetical protein